MPPRFAEPSECPQDMPGSKPKEAPGCLSCGVGAESHGPTSSHCSTVNFFCRFFTEAQQFIRLTRRCLI